MGLLDWIRTKFRPAAYLGKPPAGSSQAPRVIAGLDDEHSLYVLIDNGSGTAIVMDKDAYDYQFVPSNAPDPSQRDLDEMLLKVTRIRCLAGGMVRGKPLGHEELLDVAELDEIKALDCCLAISEDPSTFAHCMCLGGPTLVLYAGNVELATLSLHHGRTVRWKKWKHDAVLTRGSELRDWFVRNGIDAEHLDRIYQNRHGLDLPLAAPRTPAQRNAQRLVRQAAWLWHESRTENRIEALDLCRQALNADPKLAFASALLADIQKESGKFDEAVDAATTAIDLGLMTAQVYLTRAIAEDSLGNHESARADCDSVIAIDPHNAGGWNSRALIRLRTGDTAGAVEDCRQAVKLSPGWPLAHLNLGVAQSAAGDADSAIQSFGEALRLDPNLTPASLALANTHQQRGDFDLAIEEYSKVLAREPSSHLVRIQRGDAYVGKQDYDRGIADYEYVAGHVPDLAEQLRLQAVMVRVHALHSRGEYQQLVEFVNERFDEFEDPGRLYHARASALWYLGELDDAVADFTKVVMSGDFSSLAYGDRGQVYAELGNYEEALSDLETAVGMAREGGPREGLAYPLNGLGLALGGLGRFEEAFEAFSESLKLCPGNAWAYFNRAHVFQMAGDIQRAAQNYSRALKQDSPRLLERQRKIAREFLEQDPQ
ncbi:MAG: tetratricopeptide repeat protein [Planctomycetia bacterium]|nr:tetratricopeptide repeat protein [Planctomycetia bacterium]